MSATSEVSDSAPTQWANSPFPISPFILIIYSFPFSPTSALNTGHYTAYSKHPTTIASGNQRGSCPHQRSWETMGYFLQDTHCWQSNFKWLTHNEVPFVWLDLPPCALCDRIFCWVPHSMHSKQPKTIMHGNQRGSSPHQRSRETMVTMTLLAARYTLWAV